MLFKTIDQVRTHFKISSTLKLVDITPAINLVENKREYLKEYIGDDLYNALSSHVKDDGTTEKYKNILEYVRPVIVNFAFFHAVDKLDLNLSSNGFVVDSTSTSAPASANRVNKFKENCWDDAHIALNNLLLFLEENADTYSDWKDSDAYTEYFEIYLKNSYDFRKHVDIDMLTFVNWRATIKVIQENDIVPIISTELSNQIISEIKNDNVAAVNLNLLNLILPALAYLTSAEKTANDRHKNLGDLYVGRIRRLLDENEDDYPLWAYSDVYPARTTYQEKENDEASGIIKLGH